MIAPELWYEKANMAASAARLMLDADNLPATANRAYYSLYAFITGALIEAGQQPPSRHGNWPHEQLGYLVRQHMKPSFERRRILVQQGDLQRLRVLADYGDHHKISKPQLTESLRELSQVLASRER
jgi:uncharacterized protein (UPF0332 family)